MTVILAGRNREKTHAWLVADTLTSGHGHVFRTDVDRKIVRCGPGLLGCAGAAAGCDRIQLILPKLLRKERRVSRELLYAVMAGAELLDDLTSEVEFVFAQPTGILYGSGKALLTVNGLVAGVGCGAPVAMAYVAGRAKPVSLASLKAGVAYAIKHVDGCGGRITAMTARRKPRTRTASTPTKSAPAPEKGAATPGTDPGANTQTKKQTKKRAKKRTKHRRGTDC